MPNRTETGAAEQAYLLASVAADLRIGNVVNLPNFTVYAILPGFPIP
jgi:acetamidase/formamidase